MRIIKDKFEEDTTATTIGTLAVAVESEGLEKPSRKKIRTLLKEKFHMVYRKCRLTNYNTNTNLVRILR